MAGNKRKLAQLTDYKIYNDSIHGHMQFHPLIIKIIHTPQFQRLRDIKQLGLAYFVYPSASHNRFEHSLGTCHLAGLLMDILYKNKPFPKNEAERMEMEIDKLCVEIAGLCHDLGHGPLSHLWEKFILQSTGEKWKHEENSIKVFELMLAEEIKKGTKKLRSDNGDGVAANRDSTNEIYTMRDLFSDYGLGEKETELIKQLIKGKKAADLNDEEKKKHYLYQVVNNADNDIDVDKFEYICRDSKMLNLPVHFDPHRIIKLCRIAEANGTPQICFREKVCTNIADMFMARGVLFDKAYSHPKVKIIEEMAVDAFCLVKENAIFYGDKLDSTKAEDILPLTDYIFHATLNGFWDTENMVKGQQLLRRISKRQIYSIIVTVVIDHNKIIQKDKLQDLPSNIWEKLKEKNEDAFKELNKQEIGVSYVEIGSGGSNKTEPLKNVYVYGKENVDTAEKYTWDQNAPSLMPTLNTYLKRKVFIMYKGENQTILENLNKNKDTITEVAEEKLEIVRMSREQVQFIASTIQLTTYNYIHNT